MAGRIKGIVVLSRRAFVEKEFGDGAWARVLAAMKPEHRAALEGVVLASSWVPLAAVAEFDEALVRTMSGKADQALRDLGRQSAEANLAQTQANIVKGKSPQRFLAQTPVIYRLYYDAGRREYEPTGPHTGTITTFDAENVTFGDCLTVIGWHERALELCGARAVRIQHPVCRARGGAVCRYHLSWEE